MFTFSSSGNTARRVLYRFFVITTSPEVRFHSPKKKKKQSVRGEEEEDIGHLIIIRRSEWTNGELVFYLIFFFLLSAISFRTCSTFINYLPIVRNFISRFEADSLDGGGSSGTPRVGERDRTSEWDRVRESVIVGGLRGTSLPIWPIVLWHLNDYLGHRVPLYGGEPAPIGTRKFEESFALVITSKNVHFCSSGSLYGNQNITSLLTHRIEKKTVFKGLSIVWHCMWPCKL